MAILALLVLASYTAFRVTSTAHADVSSDDSTTTPIGQDILSLLSSFQSVSIDSTLFSSPLFQSLKDFSVALSPEQQGRSNPFAPIGTEAGVTTPTGSTVKSGTASKTTAKTSVQTTTQ